LPEVADAPENHLNLVAMAENRKAYVSVKYFGCEEKRRNIPAENLCFLRKSSRGIFL
jgi:hypothetical protein